MGRSDPDREATVLVIDDDPHMRMMVREVVAPTGLTVIEASSGEEGLEVAEQRHPDVILVDLVMPGMDGFETLRRLRQIDGLGYTPILVLTGLEDSDSIEQCYSEGATDFITKPIPWLVLDQRIRFVLRSSRNLQLLEQSRARMANAQRIARLGVWEWDPHDSWVECSEEGRRIFGLNDRSTQIDLDGILGTVHEDDRERVEQWVQEVGTSRSDIEHRVLTETGEERVVRQCAEALDDSSAHPGRISFVVHDVTEWRRAQQEVEYRTRHDAQTGLENRTSFQLHMEEASARSRRHGSGFALLMIDVDRFGRVNSAYGFEAGDLALSQVAVKLQDCLRFTDSLVDVDSQPSVHLARQGGDEFAVLIEPLLQVADAARVARRIVAAFGQPLRAGDADLFLSVSVGIALYPDDGTDLSDLMRSASGALRHAKKNGPGSIQYATPGMNALADESMRVETNLRRALAQDQLEVYYQPKVEVATGRVAGSEALLRWHHPELGIVSPADFIPLAEEAGIIQSIGQWVLEDACRQNLHWQRPGRPLHVAVNFSALQLQAPDPVGIVRGILEDCGLEPGLLQIEITEGTLISNMDATLETLDRFHDLGVQLALDDFGTGYSSLSYLQRLPVDVLKIDRSFITGVTVDPGKAALTTAIIRMAQSLGLKVVAEGVETEDQRAWLEERQCEQYQGYLFSPPVPADLATDLMCPQNQRV